MDKGSMRRLLKPVSTTGEAANYFTDLKRGSSWLD